MESTAAGYSQSKCVMNHPNQDARWQPATEPGWEGTKSWRTQQVVYGKERTLVMTYNQNLFDRQWATVQNDLAQALSQLACHLRAFGPRPSRRPHKGGTAPTRESVERKCQQILHRQHLRQLVQTTVILNAAAVPQLSYQSEIGRASCRERVYISGCDAPVEREQRIASVSATACRARRYN